MEQANCFENYPFWFIFVSAILQIAIYAIGAFLVFNFGLFWLIVYMGYLAVLELRLLKGHCVNCYYYGKFCAFGKGKLSALFFKKGDPKKFLNKQITWIDIAPDFLVSIIPMIVGIALLITNFSWLILALIIVLFLLTFLGNGFVRGSLACKYCKQREFGCPAAELFSKQQSRKPRF